MSHWLDDSGGTFRLLTRCSPTMQPAPWWGERDDFECGPRDGGCRGRRLPRLPRFRCQMVWAHSPPGRLADPYLPRLGRAVPTDLRVRERPAPDRLAGVPLRSRARGWRPPDVGVPGVRGATRRRLRGAGRDGADGGVRGADGRRCEAVNTWLPSSPSRRRRRTMCGRYALELGLRTMRQMQSEADPIGDCCSASSTLAARGAGCLPVQGAAIAFRGSATI